jgi:CRP-like cAMP-binding protein
MIDIEKLRSIYKFGKDVSLKDAQMLFKSAKSESIKKKTTLVRKGSKDTKIYYLRKGLVRMYHIKENGEEITFNLIPENNIVANFEFIGMQAASKFYYETLEDCSFLSLEYNVLESIISNNLKLESNRKFFLRKLLMESAERVQSFVLMNPEERYQKFVKEYPDLNNRVSDKYIAQVLGVTPVSLSRIRKRIVLKK